MIKLFAGLLLALNVASSINGYHHRRWWRSTLNVAAAAGIVAVWMMGLIP
jgi:hypothetical protein